MIPLSLLVKNKIKKARRGNDGLSFIKGLTRKERKWGRELDSWAKKLRRMSSVGSAGSERTGSRTKESAGRDWGLHES